MTQPDLPQSPAAPAARRPISTRKLILAVILAGSILFFFLILFAGLFAVVHEATPSGHSGITSILIAIKRVIVHHLVHHK